MKRLMALFFVLLLGAGLAACGGDDDSTSASGSSTTTSSTEASTSSTTAAAVASGATVAVADTGLGKVLVDGKGMTLYLFEPDTAEKSACTDQCAQTWPPMMGTATAGDGADSSKLGTAARDDGGDQVTYNGHRLYTFSGDTKPGDTNGNEIGDKWYAVTPAGEAVGE
jgi:predicted lipoprotein with Yx(FWY)xxD motif